MSWQIVGRELGNDEWVILDTGIPCPEDAIYLATEHQLAMGSGWKVVPREVTDKGENNVSVNENYQAR